MVTRLRPTRLEYVVDGVRLRSQLSTAALEFQGDEPAQRKSALEILNTKGEAGVREAVAAIGPKCGACHDRFRLD